MPNLATGVPVAGRARALAAVAGTAVSHAFTDDRGNLSAMVGADGEGVRKMKAYAVSPETMLGFITVGMLYECSHLN